MQTHDCLENIPLEIQCLDKGFVRLVDCMPRICEVGKLPEHVIANSARISYNSVGKTVKDDENLIRRLVKDFHTSPLESVKFTFIIKCPLFVAIHLIRHRTANVNQESQRYTVIKDEFFSPLSDPEKSIRRQSRFNKQKSDQAPIDEETIEIFKKIDALQKETFNEYNKLLAKGIGREVARYCIPVCVYTKLYYTMDLNNLIKFFRLRCADDAQYETQVYAKAMKELVSSLIPTVLEASGIN